MEQNNFNKKIRQIVALLPVRWKEDKKTVFCHNRIEFIYDGRRLIFQSDRESGKARVCGNWPRFDGQYCTPSWCGILTREEQFSSIGFSLSRKTKAISKDIEKRYVAQYVIYYKQCLIFVKEKEQKSNEFRIKIELLKRHFNLREHHFSRSSQLDLYSMNRKGIKSNLSISSYRGDQVDMKINDVPFDFVFQLLSMIEQYKQ